MYLISPISISLNSFKILSLLSPRCLSLELGAWSLETFLPSSKFKVLSSLLAANARNNAVTGVFLLRSILTLITPSGSVSNSSQAPLLGITFAPNNLRFLQRFAVKKTPAERINCETTTLSTPFTIKVPRSVIIGKSPR